MTVSTEYDKCLARYNSWLEDPNILDEDISELKSISGNKDEIIDRFYKDLEFGTAGLRGVIGIGTNRMNKYIVAKATQGYANYLLSDPDSAKKGVVIAYDSRNFSSEFALEASLVLAANNILVYLYDGMRSVPQLSYSISELNCAGGIVITASHNPKQYNGYKVYSQSGAQISPEIATKVLNSISDIKSLDEVKQISNDDAISSGKLNIIGAELDNKYIKYIKSLSINPDLFNDATLNIVYTPLHGTGAVTMPRLLSALNMKGIHYVEEQMMPDGNFPSVSAPNPEAKDAFDMAIDLGKKVSAPLLLATDPDADRLGVCVLNESGEYVALTGNQVGAILLDYILSNLKEKNKLLPNSYVVRSIVSTHLADKIAGELGVETRVVNTGFRFIGELVNESGLSKKDNFVFGFEESSGYLYGTKVRDKDAICAAMLLIEAVLYYDSVDMTLLDALDNLYKKFGYYAEKVFSIDLAGVSGQQKIGEIMAYIRANPPKTLGKMTFATSKDYLNLIVKDLQSNISNSLNEDIYGDIILLETKNDDWLCIRPSGTEPKIKVYACAISDTKTIGEKLADSMLQDFSDLIKVLV